MTNIHNFRKEYLWGFTQGNPIKYSKDKRGFEQLMSLLSASGTISIGATFHPYHLLDRQGNDLWEVFFKSTETSRYSDLEELVEKKSVYHIDPPSEEHFQIAKWEDERLFVERNPEFGTFVPFVLPFLSYNDGEDPLWLTQLQRGLKENYTAKDFMDRINESIRFFLPKPTLILGIDQFDKNHPNVLIDHFVNFLDNVIKTRD